MPFYPHLLLEDCSQQHVFEIPVVPRIILGIRNFCVFFKKMHI
jgi:hypothetical protein